MRASRTPIKKAPAAAPSTVHRLKITIAVVAISVATILTSPLMTDRKEIWMAESIAFFDGSYMPLKEAKISIADPAVTKSDIVFDVVSVTEGIFFRLDK